MHELALMEGIIAAVQESAAAHNITRITKIKIVVGKLTMALPESLSFAFDVLVADDDLWKDAKLEIEEKDVECRCRACGRCFGGLPLGVFSCPECGAASVEIIHGRELLVDYFEGESLDGEKDRAQDRCSAS
ncbi:MAG TPA: hydrogenase maturation nickel metallochaperone HypA [Syntrophothermus lipocalidus]|uniref:Hydrogenase maturation factor HypA n=1 Tax=Syntrophothermus lipocalidus (strain DSM 12680 / TGB-C1) TaxID=643648 RepID=D7CK53_SYNLT|nr:MULTISPECIES: hydrogenase maturation nickel metallochaperone HypA [Syntrophothermus]ADI01167.1 hydrogenase expression/synthesis HypA [Syntrophothermus lipocalidus DSM 12680]NSW81837.1 hydrogenase maturation nickel metallochaperone HypA [Syntrophothermus sp.]HHV77907.1 hydrogenase maturation nickel metallochaperone HypA [Syntrophothermus lipocalidus]